MATRRQQAERRGHSGETLAALWLRLKGYRILARRLKTQAGEIDLVAAAPFGPVCFIEVKARQAALVAAESVGPGQQTRIARAASLYLASRPHLSRRGARFDIVAIAPPRLAGASPGRVAGGFVEAFMALTVAIQMDPIEKIDIGGNSDFALVQEAQRRGHGLLYYGPRDLTFRDGKVTAHVRPLNVRAVKGDHFALGEAFVYDLSGADVVLMRQDPPFDMAYITATHILERIHPGTLVVNDPKEVRNAPEKLFVTEFADFIPPTLITSDLREIRSFRDEHKDIILKPLYGNGGAGVFRVKLDDENFGSIMEMFTQFYREPVIVQRYLPEVRKGDKRIILVDGEFAGAINRVPASGEARSNMHVGGRPEATELTPREKAICAAIGPELKKRGLIFTGIDVIGDYMTEINVTSPTGIQEVKRFGGADIAALVWEAIERKR